jgi:hypothetical protein
MSREIATKIKKGVEKRKIMRGKGAAGALIGAALILLLFYFLFPVIWPIITTASTNITSMNGTDQGTILVKSFNPLLLTLGGVGVVVGVLVLFWKKISVAFRGDGL